ncbi:MAG TPA: methyltransferase domain-containing protein [Patescibacteria group bacterium]|nr:methyltransferase domain-containing protein [Patescibacteria group bacterium]
MTGTKRFFDKLAEEYEAQSRHRYYFYRWIIQTIMRQIDNEKCEILDLGTGTGELLLRLANKFRQSHIAGLDISVAMIKKARKAAAKMNVNNVTFMVSPMEKAEIEKIDFAVSCLAFHHVANKELVISKIYQALPQNGRLVIGDWFKPCKQYKEKVQGLRSRNPQRAKEFGRSWREALRAMSKEYRKKHPKEYPICPHRLKEIMKDVGFRKQRIVKSPLASFAVVIGEK